MPYNGRGVSPSGKLWVDVASNCIYRVKGLSGDLSMLLSSACSHRKRIGKKCSIIICPLDRFNDDEPKEQIKSIW